MTNEQNPHGVHFEVGDASVKLVINSLIVIVAVLFVTLGITIFIQKYLIVRNPVGVLNNSRAPERVIPPAPQLQVHPWESLTVLRAHEDEILNGYGKDAQGHIHIPIDRAMSLVVGRLPIRPDASPGLTVPGGNAYDFTGSVNTYPPAYQTPAAPSEPQLKGKVEKSAQQ